MENKPMYYDGSGTLNPPLRKTPIQHQITPEIRKVIGCNPYSRHTAEKTNQQ
ncbi:hypothetical protein [Peribacillus kribbensis]|uniref:hypothetical protein n=1 Tax=Peribacillus kribbensis TaxID=356658 RepID=UPI000428577F|nr:hypothetical protein [Peribacillus kribbensis]